MTKEEAREIAEEYLCYLKTGAYRNVSVEQDIKVCLDYLTILEEAFMWLHNDSIKNDYIEKAIVLKAFYSGREGVGKGVINEVIKCCEKVLEEPNYKNCTELDDILDIASPSKEYDGLPAENGQQEILHRKLWRYFKRTLQLL